MILAVDPGLANAGWAFMTNSGSLHSYGHLETHKENRTGDAAARLAMVMYGLSEPLRILGQSVVVNDYGVIEWPGGASGFQREGAASGNARSAIQTSTTAGAVYGALYWLLRGRTARILTPAPITWRSALAKAWGIQRDEASIHRRILERHPQLASLKKKAAPHVLDATGLAEYGALKTQEGTDR